MYGRSSTNIFSRNASNNSSSGGNIFSRNNNSSYNNNNNNNSSYNSYNHSSYNRQYNSSNSTIGNIGSHRVPDFKVGNPPRVMEDINLKWKNTQLNPLSIALRPQTMHLSVVELRNEDYFLIRKQKTTVDIQRAMDDTIQRRCFNDNLLNSHIVDTMKEPETFRQPPPSIDVLKTLKTRIPISSNGHNPYSNNNSNSPYSNNNNAYSNNSNSNIFGRNNSNSSTIFSSKNNNSSSNIFGSNSNSNNRNIFSNTNNNNNTGGGNIFNRNSNSSNNYSNNSASNNIFGNNSNNTNRNNIFGTNNQNSNSSNIFGNNNNSGSRNIFSNNNSNSNKLFNNTNSSSNNNIFNSSSNSSNNIFSRNNNNNNNIFSNNNNNQNQYSQNNSISQFAILKMAEQNQKIMDLLVEQQKNSNGKNMSLTGLYYGEESGRGPFANKVISVNSGLGSMGNNMYRSNYTSNQGFGGYQSSEFGSYPSFQSRNYPSFSNTQYPIPEEPIVPTSQLQSINPKLQKLLTESFNPYKSSAQILVQKKGKNTLGDVYEQYPEEESLSQHHSPFEQHIRTNHDTERHENRNHVANIFHNTQSHYVQEEMEMRQQQKNCNIRRVTTDESHFGNTSAHIHPNTSHYQDMIQRNNQQQQRSLTSRTSSESRKFHLPEGYHCKFKNYDGTTVENLQIGNEFGKIFWPGKINVANVDLSENFKIVENVVQCCVPQLDKQCFVTFFSVPDGLDVLDEAAAKEGLDDFLQNEYPGNVKLKSFSILPPEYRIQIKQISKFCFGNGNDNQNLQGTLNAQSQIYEV